MTPVADARAAGRLVAKVATAGPLTSSYLLDDVQLHLSELVSEAEPLITDETGFGASGAQAVVLSRAEWAEKNVDVMLELMSPLLGKLERRLASNPFAPLMRAAYPSMVGAQLGAVLGIISHRVLGQYDVLGGGKDQVWFVGVNMVGMERRFGFIPRDFRMWVILHELTHRAQFEHNSWLTPYFREQIQGFLGSMNTDVKGIIERLLRPGDEPVALRVLPPEQRERFDRLQGMMSLIEGHGTFVMDEIGERIIGTHDRLKRTFRAQVRMANPLAKLIYRLLGMEIKRRQYEEGERFVRDVHAHGGAEAVAAAFSGPDALPTAAEITDPEAWRRRVLL